MKTEEKITDDKTRTIEERINMGKGKKKLEYEWNENGKVWK